MRKMCLLAGAAVVVFNLGMSMAHADWAIAIGQNGSEKYAYGTAWNYTDAGEAKKNALSQCRKNGPNCKVVADGAGQCIGLAFGTTDNAYGWAQDEKKADAQAAALKECSKYSKDCELKDSFCDE